MIALTIIAPPTKLLDDFLQRLSVRAMAPELIYAGLLPTSGREVGRLVRGDTRSNSYVYMYFDDIGDDLPIYVGRTIHPASRFSAHKRSARWYSDAEQYALIRLTGADPGEAMSMSIYLEEKALGILRPWRNIQKVAPI